VEHSHVTEDPRSFFRRWRVVILFGVLVVVVLVVVREFVDYRSNSPIADPYLAEIEAMASLSPRARQRLEQYYAKHQRQTVASKHYPWLCHEMQEAINQERFGPGASPIRPGPKREVFGPGCPTVFTNIYEKP
jgi:hypothetical protein